MDRWRRPVPLDSTHQLGEFRCGKPELDAWLEKRALANQHSGATKTHVVVAEDRVVGFYSLASAAVARADLSSARSRRNMPDPVPAVLLARLAVDRAHAGQGLGPMLLRSAIATAASAAERIGIVCLLVHAMDDEARRFYEHFEFEPSPTDPLHLILLLRDLPGRA